VAGAVWRRRARTGPFIGARGREGDGGDGEHRRARHDSGNGANADCDGSGRRGGGVRGWLERSVGVVVEAGRALMARRRGEGGLGGGCAGEGWARGTKLISGPWLPARGSGARGRGTRR
jgi:hypothetical protein